MQLTGRGSYNYFQNPKSVTVPIINSFLMEFMEGYHPSFTYFVNAQPFTESYNTNLWQNWIFSGGWKVFSPVKCYSLITEQNSWIMAHVTERNVSPFSSWYMAHQRLVVPFLRGGFDGQPSTEWSTSQKTSYEILIQMTCCHFWLLSSHPRHLHTRVINYQRMGITLLLTAHLGLSQGTQGRRQSS